MVDVLGISHDSVNRFLQWESYTPQDLFEEVKPLLTLAGGTLSVDDTVLDKPYSTRMARVGHFWSGKHHRVVKGIHQPRDSQISNNSVIVYSGGNYGDGVYTTMGAVCKYSTPC